MGNPTYDMGRFILQQKSSSRWRKDYALYRLMDYLEQVTNFEQAWDEDGDPEEQTYIEFSPESVMSVVMDALMYARLVEAEDPEKLTADFHRVLEGLPEKKPSINDVVASYEKKKKEDEK